MKKNKVLIELIMGIILVSIVIGMFGMIITKEKLYFVFGVLLGGATAVLLSVHLYLTIDRALDMDAKRATRYTFSMYLLRTLISAVSIIISIKVKEISIVGCFLGLMSLKVAAYFQPITNKLFSDFITRE